MHCRCRTSSISAPHRACIIHSIIMAHLTKPAKYNIADSNIALLGSDIEERVREHAGDTERAWEHAGVRPGLQIWRIENFNIVDWPKERYGLFYDGDSYIVLHTYKKDPENEMLSYDLHFWLGSETSQDEAGTAAYKTVELDDHLKGLPVQHREVQSYESRRFLSYFPRFIMLRGGVATGFHHVSALPPPDTHRLYRIGVAHDAGHPARSMLLVREVPAEPQSLDEGDVFVLDRGTAIWQFNTKTSLGKEKFRAAEFVQELVNARQGQGESVVFDEGAVGSGNFLAALGTDTFPTRETVSDSSNEAVTLTAFRLSDDTGNVHFEPIDDFTRSSLSPGDAILLDHSDSLHPVIYVWLGRNASLRERRLAVQYAQTHLHERHDGRPAKAAACIIKMNEGSESQGFLQLIDGL
ncbi:fragmin60 [Gloeopeniophorella convolvens]|nr:fragmin60 [Gloeopeniophorella convolvens]